MRLLHLYCLFIFVSCFVSLADSYSDSHTHIQGNPETEIPQHIIGSTCHLFSLVRREYGWWGDRHMKVPEPQSDGVNIKFIGGKTSTSL